MNIKSGNTILYYTFVYLELNKTQSKSYRSWSQYFLSHWFFLSFVKLIVLQMQLFPIWNKRVLSHGPLAYIYLMSVSIETSKILLLSKQLMFHCNTHSCFLLCHFLIPSQFSFLFDFQLKFQALYIEFPLK